MDLSRNKQAQRITLIGSLLDAILGVGKFFLGLWYGSSALVADGIHSISDLATDMFVVAIFKYSDEPPDHNHPWGHGRFETLGTTALGAMLIAVAGAICYENLRQLGSSFEPLEIGLPALLLVGFSIAAKEWIFRRTLALGKALNAKLLIANAWHSRTDAISSAVVLFGLLASNLGYPALDSIAAVIVALMIAKVGWELAWDSLKELTDIALDEEQIQGIKSTALAVPGVVDAHSLKSRQMAAKGVLEIHLQVEPLLSASEAHRIGNQVLHALTLKFDNLAHIIFHIDTYDDQDLEQQHAQPSNLPGREQIELLLSEQLTALGKPLTSQHIRLFYHRSELEIELLLPADWTLEPQLAAQARQFEQQHSWCQSLTIYLETGHVA